MQLRLSMDSRAPSLGGGVVPLCGYGTIVRASVTTLATKKKTAT